MEEIEFIEKYMFICDKDGNKSHIKLSETQKRFLEYIKKCNVKSSFALQRMLHNNNKETNNHINKRHRRSNYS